MLPISEKTLRASFVNASRKETADLTLPADLDTIDWDGLDYLGWRDPKIGRRAYVVVPTLDGDLVGILFRQAEASPRSRAQCSWCQDVKLPNDVVFYSAKRSGKAGRNGNTVGTLVCQDFQCSRNVRKTPPLAYEGYDVEAARLQRIEDLQLRAAAFAAEV
uniref:FBP domain-containing protein n=1 Tax=Neobacillus citreus TaxID=2833578 RepID=A0A942SWU2_9BACI